MSRVIDESNVAQAIREIVQSLIVLPGGVMVILAHERGSDSGRRSTLFFIWAAVLIGILFRELAWISKMLWWRIQNHIKRSSRNQPRKAYCGDFIFWTVVHTMLGLFGPLRSVTALVLSRSNGWKLPFPLSMRVSESIAVGINVSVLTGDVLSGGVIAAVERWGDVTGNAFAVHGTRILLALFVPTVILCYLHAIRTILALFGYDNAYLVMVKAVRWHWDAHSEHLALSGRPLAILASTSRRPFLRKQNGTTQLTLGLRN